FGSALWPPFEARVLGVAEELLERRSLLGSGSEQVDRALLDGGGCLLAIDVERVLTLKGDRRDDTEQPKARSHRIEGVRIRILAGELVYLPCSVDDPNSPYVVVDRISGRAARRSAAGEPAHRLMSDAAEIGERPPFLVPELP